MENWIKAEAIVKNLTGGKFTPASGARKQKGDVVTSNWMIEVKQTEKEYIDIQYNWLKKLQGHKAKKNLALVIFFKLSGYVYYFEPQNVSTKPWKTLRVSENNLPSSIYSLEGVWELDSLSSLKDLN